VTGAAIFDGFGPDNPLLMVAAGVCKGYNRETVQALAAAADKVVIGSITLDPRTEYTGVCEYFDDPLYSLNAWSMPNLGSRAVPTIDEALRSKLIFSLAEFSPDGYGELVRRTAHWGCGVELNFGCPNVSEDGVQHRIISFNPSMIHMILQVVRLIVGNVPIGIKLSPYSDPGLIREVASVITNARRRCDGRHLVSYVAVTNTFPNGRAYTPDRRPALWTEESGPFGGIGGEALKPISLSNAAQFRAALPDEIAVIRVGGISSGADVWQSYDIGCTGVQIATAIAQKGIGVFNTIRQDYADTIG
jgi:dihydroorotate dehydrogenase (fumarate)